MLRLYGRRVPHAHHRGARAPHRPSSAADRPASPVERCGRGRGGALRERARKSTRGVPALSRVRGRSQIPTRCPGRGRGACRARSGPAAAAPHARSRARKKASLSHRPHFRHPGVFAPQQSSPQPAAASHPQGWPRPHRAPRPPPPSPAGRGEGLISARSSRWTARWRREPGQRSLRARGERGVAGARAVVCECSGGGDTARPRVGAPTRPAAAAAGEVRRGWCSPRAEVGMARRPRRLLPWLVATRSVAGCRPRRRAWCR